MPPSLITFLLTSLPFFVAVALGALAGRLKMIREEGVPALNGFAFYFAAPALIVRLLAHQSPQQSFHPGFFLGWVATGLSVYAVVAGLTLIATRRPMPIAASQAQAATISNIVFLGVPLALTLVGERAAGPLATALICDLGLIISMTIALLNASARSADPAGTKRSASSLGRLVLGFFVNPFILSIAGGLGLSLLGIALPEPVDRFLAFLGAGAAPAGLFALGLSLSQRVFRADIGAVALLSAAKLIVHPLAAWTVLSPLLHLDHPVVATGVLLAALPTASNVFVIARHYGADPERISAVVLVTTSLAAVTFPLAAWLMLG
jgi:malonate transporter